MSYIGKTVRLSNKFLRNTGQFTGDAHLQQGVVISETVISKGKALLYVDDAAFGEWKAVSTNVAVINGAFRSR